MYCFCRTFPFRFQSKGPNRCGNLGIYLIYVLRGTENSVTRIIGPVPTDERYRQTSILYVRMREVSSIKIAHVLVRSHAYTHISRLSARAWICLLCERVCHQFLHFGLNTRPSACITVTLSSQPNDLNLLFFTIFDLLLLLFSPFDAFVYFACIWVSSLHESV